MVAVCAQANGARLRLVDVDIGGWAIVISGGGERAYEVQAAVDGQQLRCRPGEAWFEELRGGRRPRRRR
jgi:hypothetical protein